MLMERLEQDSLKVDVLQKYGTDMTSQAELGMLDPVIGRENEIDRLTQILLKRGKGNACLIGDQGVGKTAIVKGLAIRIAAGSVPSKFIGKKVFSIDMARLNAGAVHDWQLEERVINLLDQVQENKGAVILFIDEIHALLTIVKLAIARGDFKCIGATRVEEYRAHIEEDAALNRRFEAIEIAEPSRDDAVAMLKGLAPAHEMHHGVIYTQPALIHAVDQSMRRVRERRLPDKAVDLIDEGGARSRMLGQTFVTTAEIEHVVSAWTTEPPARDPRGLEDALKKSLVGQDEAAAAVSRCIRRARAGIRDETKPLGSFLFTGPSGVGKTEMAKLLARECFGGAEAVVRLDGGGGGCVEQVRRRPCSVVLLDEVERAGGEVLNVLLGILDDGRVRDEKGKTVDFRNTIVIVTSNMDMVSAQLRDRLDQVVEFKPLEKEHMMGVLEIMLHQFCDRVAQKKRIEVRFSQGLKEKLIVEGCSKSCGGARELKRTITRLVEDKLAQEIFNGSVAETHKVTMDVGFAGEVVIWGW